MSMLGFEISEQLPDLCDHVGAQASQLIPDTCREVIEMVFWLGIIRRRRSSATSVGNRVAVVLDPSVFRAMCRSFDSPWG